MAKESVTEHFSDVIVQVIREAWLVIIILLIGSGVVFSQFVGFGVVWEFVKKLWPLVWPIILAFILFPLFVSIWVHWRQQLYKNVHTKWRIFEIKIPREIKKDPKAMEQVLASLHGMRNSAGDFREFYWEGEVTRWITLEIVSFGGEVHFYVRYRANLMDLVQGVFNAQYPDVEFEEVTDTDYAQHKLPQTVQEMYMKDYDLWGSEMILKREGAYPIKRYKEFQAPAEEKEYDTMSAFLEVLGKLKKEEFAGIQYLIAPMAANWRKKYDPLIEKLRKPKREKERTVSVTTGEVIEYEPFVVRTPGETTTLENLEENLVKPAFLTLIRFIYISPKRLFYDAYPRRGIRGCFTQFTELGGNTIVNNENVATRVKFWNFPYFFPALRDELRKQRILFNYIHRDVPPERWMGKLAVSSPFDLWGFKSKRFEMTTECIATVYHLPTYIALTAPHAKRVESRKMAPPAGLPIYGSEEDIEKYL